MRRIASSEIISPRNSREAFPFVSVARQLNAASGRRLLFLRCFRAEVRVTKGTISVAIIACAAACVRPAQPTVATVPMAAHEPASTPVPVTQQAAAIPDAKPAAAPIAYDSIHVDSTAIARRAMDVFGDAPAVPAAAPADATAAGPSW